jgi:hypothetical protein
MRSAARISPDLLTMLDRLDDGRLPIAEIARRLGVEAEARGRPRPGYERIRQLVQELRLDRQDAGPSQLRLAVEVTTGLRSRDSFNREFDRAVERNRRKADRRK